MKIKTILTTNALFSLTSGTLMLIAGDSFMELFPGSLTALPHILGIGLLGFAAFLMISQRKDGPSATRLFLIILMDWSWVAGSALLLILMPDFYSASGALWIIGCAIIVALLALLQGRAYSALI